MKALTTLKDQDIEIIYLKSKESDEKIDSVDFAARVFKAIKAILLDKLKHSIVDYQNETGITFKGVFEKFDLKKTSFVTTVLFEKILDEYRVELNETMKRILLVTLDQNGSKSISYHYIVKIFDLDSMDQKKQSIVVS